VRHDSVKYTATFHRQVMSVMWCLYTCTSVMWCVYTCTSVMWCLYTCTDYKACIFSNGCRFMKICIYVRNDGRWRVSMHAYTFNSKDASIHTHTHTHTHQNLHAFIQKYTCMYRYRHTQPCMHILRNTQQMMNTCNPT